MAKRYSDEEIIQKLWTGELSIEETSMEWQDEHIMEIDELIDNGCIDTSMVDVNRLSHNVLGLIIYKSLPRESIEFIVKEYLEYQRCNSIRIITESEILGLLS